MISSDMDIPTAEQFPLLAEAGFDAFFTSWEDEATVRECKKLADEYGLTYSSVHGPSTGKVFATHMWHPGDEGKAVARDLMRIIEICSDNEIGMLVNHVHSGFEYDLPTVEGGVYAIENFRTVADRARELGVKLALENIESFELNEVLLEAFLDHPAVGFCWDCGHECCYYNGIDLTKDYGGSIIAVHLHDNMGCGNADGSIASRDDMHMLPFDGIIDWQNVCDRLDAHGFEGVMMLEIKRKVWYSDRTENAAYMKMTPREYVNAAYASVSRLVQMRKNKRGEIL